MFHVPCFFYNVPSLSVSDIPHFKQVVIMATTCTYCGYKSNEVKSGSGVSETGTQIKLNLTHVSDLSRDLIQVHMKIHVSDFLTYVRTCISKNLKSCDLCLSHLAFIYYMK